MQAERPIYTSVEYERFLSIVEQGTGLGRDAARHATRVTLETLAERISRGEARDLAEQLLPRGPHVDAVTADKLVRRVAERAVLDEGRAWEITETVLETLAERIAGGEVEDLLVHLPVHLHPALRRGNAASGGKAVRRSADEF